MRRMAGILALLISVTGMAFPQGNAVLSGRVVEKSSRHALPGAIVSLEGTRLGICANDNGYFELTAVPPGSYRVHVSVLGYTAVDSAVTLADGDHRTLQFELTETVYQINPVTVTATRERSLVSDVPASVDVLPARELSLRNIQDIGQAIENMSGVGAKNYGGLGDLKTASIRGSSSSQVLVLVDGQRLNDAQSGDVDLSSIPIESVEQIEVVRGGTSALYGADAVGGVINIITKNRTREAGLGGSAGLLSGSWGTRGVNLSGEYAAEKFFSVVSYKFLKSDGDFPYRGPTGQEVIRQNGDMLSHGLFGKGSWNFGEDATPGTFTASGQYFVLKSGVAGTVDAPSLEARKRNEEETLNLVFEQKVFSPYNTVSVQSYFNNLIFAYDDPGSYIPTHSNNHNRAAGMEAKGRVVLTDWDILTAGYAFRGDFLSGTSLPGTESRRLNSVYGQMELSPQLPADFPVRKVIAIPAVRWDNFSDFGGEVSPKLGVVVSTGDEWQVSLKANFGSSFRAPAFNDLYWPKDAYSVGNPALKPEHGKDFDCGTMIRLPYFPGIAFDLTYFRNSVTDMILWLQGANGIWSPENVGKAEIQGVEVKASISPWKDVVQASWNYTYLDARNRTDDPTQYDMQLPYRPRNVHNASLRLGSSGLYSVIDYSYTGKRYTTTANTASLPPYHLVNALVGYRLPFESVSLDAKFEVRNIEDLSYQAMEGYPMPGREFRLSLDVRFSQLTPSQ